ncbi:MAG: Na+/proline symporter [Alphaproteobacteria bacterium]|nr:Na+/proline symporter [Alphaproteobacteria bacterium]
MSLSSALPWLVLVGYCALIWRLTPRRVTPSQFFDGKAEDGSPPGLWLLVASAAVTWVFAKSISNAASLAGVFGVIGGVGYAFYYLSFLVAGVAIYFIRTRGGHSSLSGFLVSKYGVFCARLFLIAISIRLFNEVWSNTKVAALFFGNEGTLSYWLAAALVTGFTVYYSWRGGLRSSLLTDGAQMLMAAVLLVVVMVVIWPDLAARGIPNVPRATHLAGWTFAGLALVQVLSYPFHDPVMTDRAFLTSPTVMLRAFIIAGLIAGGFILIYSGVGLYALSVGADGNPSVVVPILLGLPMMLVFNGLMLTSAGSTLDSTFSSTSKLVARDWDDVPPTVDPGARRMRLGRYIIVAIAVLGNLPLLSIYLGDRAGPAVIAATTISGTMVMGLAPIFLLSWIPTARRLSFHFAFWPGLLFGVLLTLESALGIAIFPTWVDLGTGVYADDFGVNVFGLALVTTGFVFGAVVSAVVSGPAMRRDRQIAPAE